MLLCSVSILNRCEVPLVHTSYSNQTNRIPEYLSMSILRRRALHSQSDRVWNDAGGYCVCTLHVLYNEQVLRDIIHLSFLFYASTSMLKMILAFCSTVIHKQMPTASHEAT